jgi:6-pyruvoyltetrahydropterin/6-carboxytetrahydropterin synthase
MTVTKKYTMEYAHIVRNAYSKRCRENIHGHSGICEVTLESAGLNSAGMVMDFGEMKPIKALVDLFDHCFLLWDGEEPAVKEFILNNFNRVIVMKQNPTAENMAAVILHYAYKWVMQTSVDNARVASVTVHETATGKATATTFSDQDILMLVQDTEDVMAELGDFAENINKGFYYACL